MFTRKNIQKDKYREMDNIELNSASVRFCYISKWERVTI